MPIRNVMSVDATVELSSLQLNKIAAKYDVAPDNLKIEQGELSELEFSLLYEQRFESICNGAKFLLQNLPLDFPSINIKQRQALFCYIAQLQESLCDDLGHDELSINDYTNSLYKHSCLLTAAFALRLNKDHKTTVHMLSKGEEYYMLTRPRDDLITLTKIDNSKGHFYILQKEAQLPPLSETLINDYWAVSQGIQPAPQWFESLEPLEQRILKNVLKDVSSKEDISKTIINLSSRLRTLPGAANFRNHIVTLYDEDLNKLKSYKRSASSMISSRDVQSKSQEVRDFHASENLNQIVEQVIEDKIIKELKARSLKNGDKISIEVPGIAQTLISPVIPSFLQPDFKLVVDKKRAINDFIFEKSQTRQVVNEQGEPISISVDIKVKFDSMNHSLNLANRWDYTSPDNAGCQNFITSINSYLSKHPQQSNAHEIKALLEQYIELLAKGSLYHVNFHDLNMRELFLSSLEQLITVRQNGIAYGSCVSAKDRKALEFMHTDAMELYHHWYGNWPLYNDVENSSRAAFVDIFAHLYISRHHQRSASLNAPGSEGIKTPTMYLPIDITTSIESYYAKFNPQFTAPLSDDDVLASMNELRSIVKLCFAWSWYEQQAEINLTKLEKLVNLPSNNLPTTLSAPSPGDRYLLASLAIISEVVAAKSKELKEFWNSNTSYKADLFKLGGIFNTSRPDGIKKIDALLIQNKGEINVQLLAKIFSEINPRIATKAPYSRFPQTTNFYKLIELMYYGDRSNKSSMKAIYQKLRQFYFKAAGTLPEDIDMKSANIEDKSVNVKNPVKISQSEFGLFKERSSSPVSEEKGSEYSDSEPDEEEEENEVSITRVV